ncbi:hypothetical protein DNTS_013279 [Danionella cerebrum]|uniref:Uncharacterized protein n=1 Tax=Danionella cerebrum TaxID=2873325 RepID=A0A553RQE9_9TELE|nr:hypothetical protein DNTS_013279 [Danionella translucida]
MFLPQTEGPKCDSGSAEVSIHAEPAEYLSDVYCFNPADSSTTCEEDPQSIMNTNTATENGKPHGDILSEAKSEGFLVDFEEILGNIQKDASPPSDLEVTNVEDVKTVEETSTLTKNKDTHHPRDVLSSPSSPFLWYDQEGSGIQSPFTTSPITKEPIEFVNLQDNFFEPGLSEVPVRRTSNKGLRLLQPFLTPPPSASLKEGSPSTWMIITAFCVIVGAIVCILVAIGTRDMWYGPRKSRNITTQENDKDYSKTATIPLSEKEQEIVALMNVTNLKNGKMADVTGVDENEKEYLM